MDGLEGFVLGVMAAWTPGLVLLAWMLRGERRVAHSSAD
jgi:hypothetical protein